MARPIPRFFDKRKHLPGLTTMVESFFPPPDPFDLGQTEYQRTNMGSGTNSQGSVAKFDIEKGVNHDGAGKEDLAVAVHSGPVEEFMEMPYNATNAEVLAHYQVRMPDEKEGDGFGCCRVMMLRGTYLSDDHRIRVAPPIPSPANVFFLILTFSNGAFDPFLMFLSQGVDSIHTVG